MKRPVNKGQRCQRWKRVRVKGLGGNRALRCAAYDYPPRHPGGIGYRRGHRPDNKGKGCRKFKLVYSPWFNKKVYRCVDFDGRGRLRMPRTLAPAARKAVRALPMTGRQAIGIARKKASDTAQQLMYGYIPLSLPSMERMTAGRTPR
jgi:hypothetical protein